MITRIIMPKFGLTMKEGRVSAWLKNEGDAVGAGEKVVEVSTPKVTHVLESKGGGVLRKQLAPVNAVLPVGEVIGLVADADEELPDIQTKILRIQKPGEKPAAKSPTKTAVNVDPGLKVMISPAARRMAEKAGVDYTHLSGTGPGGRIVKEDIEKAIEEGISSVAYGEEVEISDMRRSVWEAMDLSARTVARVTHFVQVDMTHIDNYRKSNIESFEKKYGFRFTYTDVLVRLLALAVQADPVFNVYLSEEGHLYKRDGIHIGLAVALEGGLVVGKVPDADKSGLGEIATRARDIADKAKRGVMSLDESTGISITLTTLGATGIDAFTPIINLPEPAILGVGAVKERPIVKDGAVAPAPTCWLTLSFDHRLVDGYPAAKFLESLKKLVENPVKNLMEP